MKKDTKISSMYLHSLTLEEDLLAGCVESLSRLTEPLSCPSDLEFVGHLDSRSLKSCRRAQADVTCHGRTIALITSWIESQWVGRLT
jgi:hypothetical protein